MKNFFESELNASDYVQVKTLDEDCDMHEYSYEEAEAKMDTDPDMDEASKDALKQHDRGKYASGERKKQGYDKEGKKIKKRKIRSTPKHKSTSTDKAKRKKDDKKRDRIAGRR